jgi:hypothetical protein
VTEIASDDEKTESREPRAVTRERGEVGNDDALAIGAKQAQAFEFINRL